MVRPGFESTRGSISGDDLDLSEVPAVGRHESLVGQPQVFLDIVTMEMSLFQRMLFQMVLRTFQCLEFLLLETTSWSLREVMPLGL